MHRTTTQVITLAAVTAVLTAACAGGPARRPGGAGPTPGESVSSTTGDADACAIALGNSVASAGTVAPGTTGAGGAETTITPPGTTGTTGTAATPGTMEVTANGVLIGNVALVGIPSADHMPLGQTGAATPATPATPARPATPTIPATPGTAFDRTAAPGAPGTTTVAPGATRATPATPATPAAPATPAPANTAVGAGTTNPTALDRVRAACTKVAEIRVVNSAADRLRLAEVAQAIRHGEPITSFMDDLSAMMKRATVAPGATGATGTTQAPGTGATRSSATGVGTTPGTRPGAMTPAR